MYLHSQKHSRSATVLKHTTRVFWHANLQAGEGDGGQAEAPVSCLKQSGCEPAVQPHCDLTAALKP